ncbi:hypothetical protein K435DRAFT_880651 [Dendrothele bispora CBS 962.96]|uniref:Uncharacterized protein n=1 Tax=Dendrothele bispora (strain CBS 962.96) TaxID=1314807 RepID=A0A4S8KJJ9_DENBC|nr:hypothetical protein K435DRAFT_880651 [Dendrothele bispora CBS 962.96]
MGMHILELPFHIQEASDVTPICLSLPLPPGPAKEVQSIPEIVTQIITREAPKDANLHTHDPVKMFPLLTLMLPHFHTPSVSRIINLPKRHKPPHRHDHQRRSHRPTITLEVNTTHKMPPSRDLDPDTLVDLKVDLEVVLCPPRTHTINEGRIGKTFSYSSLIVRKNMQDNSLALFKSERHGTTGRKPILYLYGHFLYGHLGHLK